MAVTCVCVCIHEPMSLHCDVFITEHGKRDFPPMFNRSYRVCVGKVVMLKGICFYKNVFISQCHKILNIIAQNVYSILMAELAEPFLTYNRVNRLHYFVILSKTHGF